MNIEDKTIAELRAAGYAVAYLSPEHLCHADADEISHEMEECGHSKAYHLGWRWPVFTRFAVRDLRLADPAHYADPRNPRPPAWDIIVDTPDGLFCNEGIFASPEEAEAWARSGPKPNDGWHYTHDDRNTDWITV